MPEDASRMRRIHRTDLNQSELLDYARKLGMHIEVIGRPTDAVVCINGRLFWLEIKNPEHAGKKPGRKREYTEAQHDFIDRCALSGAPMLTWRSKADIDACCELIP